MNHAVSQLVHQLEKELKFFRQIFRAELMTSFPIGQGVDKAKPSSKLGNEPSLFLRCFTPCCQAIEQINYLRIVHLR